MTKLQERITLTAKHFINIAENQNEDEEVNSTVQIIFDEDVCPQTDGEKIYLPTSMNEERLWELLGALLHECLHIRYTKHENISPEFKKDGSLFHVLNCLEDMRLNHKAVQLFPKTKLFFHALYYYLAKNKKDRLKTEPLSFQILKNLTLNADNFPTYSDIAMDIIKKHNLEKYIKIAHNATDIGQLLKPAKELFNKLQEICQEELSNMDDEELANFLKNLKKDLESEIEKSWEEFSKQLRKLNEARGKLKKLQSEWKKWHRRMATNRTRNHNLRQEAKDLENDAEYANEHGDYKRQKELESQAQHKIDLADAAKFRRDEASKKLSDIEQEKIDTEQEITRLNKLVNNLRNDYEELKKLLDDLLKNGAGSVPAGFGYSPIGLNGLETLDTQDLCFENSYKLPRKLEDTIREVFLRKKEDREIDNEGCRLNRNNLHRIVTDCQRLFETPIQPPDKTKIAFLLDSSGSMYGRRAELVNTAFAYLFNSLNDVLIKDQLDVEIGVYSFNHSLQTLKDYKDEMNGDKIIEQYSPRGGTCIEKNLNKVIEKMQNDGQNEKRIVILLTDAEVYDDELNHIKNNVNFEDVNVVFLGIDINNHWNTSEVAKQLFLDNITEESNVVEILTNALLRHI